MAGFWVFNIVACIEGPFGGMMGGLLMSFASGGLLLVWRFTSSIAVKEKMNE